MKILVTSGGTKIPIDRVRDITNMSSGTFGSKIALEFLKLKQDVVFFCAEKSRNPFKVEVDMLNDEWGQITEKLLKQYEERVYFKEHYMEYTYKTFDQYAESLKFIIGVEQPDIIVLAAAVSDYGIDKPFDGKIRSDDMLNIQLKSLPKIISMIKEWAPKAKLVGFKLLVDSKKYQLIAAAEESVVKNGCDMVVANDLQDIKDNQHRLQLVFPKSPVVEYKADPNDPNFLARMVAEQTIKL